MTPDESSTGVWPAGPRDGYTGSFESAGFEGDGYEGRGGGFGGGRLRHQGLRPRFPATRRTKTSTTSRAAVVTAVAVAVTATTMTMAMITVTAADAAGRSLPARWCCWCCCSAAARTAPGGTTSSSTTSGVQDGYVAVFQGTNQSLAGMSLSKLLTRSTLQVSQLGLNDQNTLAQTISKSSVTDAKNLIDGLQNQVDLVPPAMDGAGDVAGQNRLVQRCGGQGQGVQGQAEADGSGLRRSRAAAVHPRPRQLRPGLGVRHPGVGAARFAARRARADDDPRP